MLESLLNNKFTYKKLTEDEQAKRGILGRLTGVIADAENPTRNGRKYGKELWENVFNDPVMQEKIENRCCFGELGHPTDREEVDPEKIAICLAETPKIGRDGKLYGVFDILNTPCGKILKSLCDYGTNIGVSSRGSGDIMDNDEVDPETYYCECWDAVLLPAVKSARQTFVTESLDKKSVALKKALRESYESASDEDKKVMEETLDNLGIVLEEPIEEEVHEDGDFEVELVPVEPIVEAKEEEKEAETEEEIPEETEEAEEQPEEEKTEKLTVGDLQKELKEFDKKSEIIFSPISIDEKEIPVKSIDFTASEDGTVVVNIGYNSEMSDNIEEVENAEEDVEMSTDNIRELVDDAEDNGDEEVLESLKEAIRQKDLLENELKTLKSEKTVSDTEVNKLQEELSKYKSAFARTSKIAAEAKKSEEDVKSLTEQLNQKDKEIESIKESQKVKLDESMSKNATTIHTLNENLKIIKNELEEKENKLLEQANVYKKKLIERTEIAKKYKSGYEAVLNEYINFRASLLGVRPADITNKLAESYTLADVNNVCEKMLTESVNMPRLNIGQKSRVKINEAKPSNKYDDDDLSDLYDLAGLK